ncbi:uncharacterized protein LOC136082595 [Hydra vulgaris]|uniref:uncharacterized protein LOC136082595 n=1 Tax=Hydra vulgaris TaxID=6087 RepID=UPI0032EA8E70
MLEYLINKELADEFEKGGCGLRGLRTKQEAAKHYGIPRTTLRDKLSGKALITKKMGPATFLIEAEEHVLQNISQQCIKQWFSDIRSYLLDDDCLDILYVPDHNFNIDESGFVLSPIRPKVLAEKGSKNVPYSTSSKEKERITVLANISADGSFPPPLIIYPNVRIPINVYASLPPTLAAIGKSESG